MIFLLCKKIKALCNICNAWFCARNIAKCASIACMPYRKK